MLVLSQAPRAVRLAGATRDPLGGVRIHLGSGENIVIDSASVELRSVSGQLLQQMALPLLPLTLKATMQLQNQQAIQRQILEQFPQQRRHLTEQLQLRQLQKQALQLARAAALQQAMPLGGAHLKMPQPPTQPFSVPLQQQQQQQLPKRRLHVRRINGTAQTTDPPLTASPAAATQQSSTDGLSKEAQETNTSPRVNWSGLNVGETEEVCQAGPAGSGRYCRWATEGAPLSEGTAASANTADLTRTNPSREDQEKLVKASANGFGKPLHAAAAHEPPSEMQLSTENTQIGLKINPTALVPTAETQWRGAPRRDLLATQAVGGVAVVADALSRVGQAILVGPMSLANTMDAAGALFASPVPPVVNAPLQVSNFSPLLTNYGLIGTPYTFGCGSFDPHCLQLGLGYY